MENIRCRNEDSLSHSNDMTTHTEKSVLVLELEGSTDGIWSWNSLHKGCNMRKGETALVKNDECGTQMSGWKKLFTAGEQSGILENHWSWN